MQQQAYINATIDIR
ncbi:TPA: DUF3113 family protein, partial [Staphylococcus aureus]|nr:DUF3113 family protein [Staphylococcus aureus]MBU7112389.1 DUF3113 family protein [Staphylococcus aureus]MCD0799620.1 DUF3113 family protein [Staphylococcus aureus]MCD0800978.1 DUF3113 family protein [Staphylococcus aureus]NGW13178.1 DUF3113 family protein [Staphylococcus aureus]